LLTHRSTTFTPVEDGSGARVLSRISLFSCKFRRPVAMAESNKKLRKTDIAVAKARVLGSHKSADHLAIRGARIFVPAVPPQPVLRVLLRSSMAQTTRQPVTFEDIRLIRRDIRASYALPVRDYLEFSYGAQFPNNDSARLALGLAHYNLFLSALSRDDAELSPLMDMLRRLSERFGAPSEVIEDINRSLILELMKMTTFQRRNSPDAIAAYNLVVAEIAHSLWSALAEPGQRQPQAA
jgi:hypothetical protein